MARFPETTVRASLKNRIPVSVNPTTRNPWIVVPVIGAPGLPVAGSNCPTEQMPLTKTVLPSEFVHGLASGCFRGFRTVPCRPPPAPHSVMSFVVIVRFW